MTRLRWMAALLAAALPACSSLPAAEPDHAPAAARTARHPASGLQVVPLTIDSRGSRHRLQVEVASSGAEQERGLMFRTAMGADEGMIFLMEPPRQASFWMKNTVIPLDIVFIDPAGRIESIAAGAVPYSLEPINSRGIVAAVLEINGGRAAQLGLTAGDRVAWSLAPSGARP